MNSLIKKRQERAKEVLRRRRCLKLTLWHSSTFTPIFIHSELEPIMAAIGFYPIVPGSPERQEQTKELAMRDNDGADEEYGDILKVKRVAVAGTNPRVAAKKPEVAGTKPEQVPGLKQGAVSGTRPNGGALVVTKPERVEVSRSKQVQWREYEFKGMNSVITESNLDDLLSRPCPRLPYPRLDGLHLASYLTFLSALESYVNPYVVVNLFLIRPIEMSLKDVDPNSIYRPILNMSIDSELETDATYFGRWKTLDRISKENYGQLRASVGDISCNNLLMKHVRKDSRRQIEEDERDDSSDFVCLVDNVVDASFTWTYMDPEPIKEGVSRDESLCSMNEVWFEMAGEW